MASGALRPLSPRYEPGYNPQWLGTSRRRAAAERFLRRVRNKLYVNDIDVANIRRASTGAGHADRTPADRFPRFGT